MKIVQIIQASKGLLGLSDEGNVYHFTTGRFIGEDWQESPAWELLVSSSDTLSEDESPKLAGPACRQRLMEEGKPYPKSSCALCGALSPRWKECNAIIEAEKPKPYPPSFR